MKKQFVLAGFAVTVLMACATSPYTISQYAGNVFNDKKIAIVEIGIADHGLAILPLIDAGIYNTALAIHADKLKEAQIERGEDLRDKIAECFIQNYNAEVVRASYPFVGDGLAMTYFSNPSSDDVIPQLTGICEENDSDYIVTIMSQYVTTGVSAFGIKGGNHLRLRIDIFDREGNLIGSGTVDSPGNSLTAGDIAGFKLLYYAIVEPTRELIMELGN
ncbi:MAG: hypothetical protein LBK61_02290 [Spirochaetaceae bacterium]|nr:hypothetical protein [Spirochaetaceae bacterium]